MAALTAPLVSLESVSKAYATTVVLDGVSLGIAAGERTGVVGRNGGGKTTLLRIVTGQEQPDAGRWPGPATSGSGGRPARRPARQHRPRRRAGPVRRGARVGRRRRVCARCWAGSGCPGSVSDSSVERLSGGERRRVALAARLVARSDLLVLDEPTNHLDVEGVAWLAEHLKAAAEALVVVTHDRWFLDEVCETTWEVGDGTVRRYDGGYSAYVLARAERPGRRPHPRLAGRTCSARSWPGCAADRRPARASRGSGSRPPSADRRRAAAAGLHPLQAFATRRLGKSVYDVEDVTLALGDRTLLRHVTWRLGPGDRVAVVGVNGAGKTTLLRLLLGQQQPDRGTVRVDRPSGPATCPRTCPSCRRT
jgi:ATP-binding cassette subfamily F protein uup